MELTMFYNNNNLSPKVKRILPTNQFDTDNLNCCSKCNEKVYPVERVGPVKERVYHKQCFKCSVCNQTLGLRNYYTNPIDSNDKALYCEKHCPKIRTVGCDAQALAIKLALQAPSKGLQSNDLVRWFGDGPKIGTDALYIREALDTQSEFERKYLLENKHHFQVYIAKQKKEKIKKFQQKLEAQQRKEEDQLMKIFYEERKQETEIIEKEINEEWEINMTQLRKQLEKKLSFNNPAKKELEELNKTMTLKRDGKIQILSLKLQTKAQEKTSTMVKKHSQEMLELLQNKQGEIEHELREELSSSNLNQDLLSPNSLTEVLNPFQLPENIPNAHPPKMRKRDLYQDAEIFEQLDAHVFKVAETEYCSFTELVDKLTANCMNDLQKARAIFRWITVKDLNVIEFSESVKQDTPMGILRGIKFGTETYHTLFMRLCSFAGLVCKEIKGYSKSVGYEPGMKIKENTFQNIWNVVLIMNDWWPVQCNWAARHLVNDKNLDRFQKHPPNSEIEKNGGTASNKSKEKRTDGKVHYSYDEHYFLTDPDEFVYEFLALDGKWQLLENPLSLEEFENKPFVRSCFFQFGLEFEDNMNSVIRTDPSGLAEIKLKIPVEFAKALVFYYHLRFADKDKRHILAYKGYDLSRFVFLTHYDSHALLSVHAPCVTSYFLEIFCANSNKKALNNSRDFSIIDNAESFNLSSSNFNTNLNNSLRLKCISKFKIVCENLCAAVRALPNCTPGEWGPSKAERQFGIISISHPISIINVKRDVEIILKLCKPTKLVAKLYFNGIDRTILNSFISIDFDEEKLLSSIYVTFPSVGQFGIDICKQVEDSQIVNDSSSSGSLVDYGVKNLKTNLVHVCKYLVNCTEVEKTVPLEEINTIRAKSIDNFSSDSKTMNENISHSITENSLQSNLTFIENSGKSSTNKIVSNWQAGPTEAFEMFKIKLSTQKNPIVKDTTGKLIFDFTLPTKYIKLSFKLISILEQEEKTNSMTIKEEGTKVKVKLGLTQSGDYRFVIFGNWHKEEHQENLEIYNYFLEYRNKTDSSRTIKK